VRTFHPYQRLMLKLTLPDVLFAGELTIFVGEICVEEICIRMDLDGLRLDYIRLH